MVLAVCLLAAAGQPDGAIKGAVKYRWVENFPIVVFIESVTVSEGRRASSTRTTSKTACPIWRRLPRGVISFGVDWLQTHPHPVEAQKAFASLRDRNTPILFIGPRFNLTAMRSHEWLACRAGFEPLVALMLAHLLGRERSGTWRASGGVGEI